MISRPPSYASTLSCADVQPAFIHAAFKLNKGRARRSGHGLAREGKRSAVTCTANALRLRIECQGAPGVGARQIQCCDNVSTAIQKDHPAIDVDDPASPMWNHVIDRPKINRFDSRRSLLLQIRRCGQRESGQSRDGSNRPKP